jgi:ankyrin repeat protein
VAADEACGHALSTMLNTKLISMRCRCCTTQYIAAQTGTAGAARKLLQKGASPDAAADDGTTPLWAAAYNGQDRIVKLMLQDGALLVT